MESVYYAHDEWNRYINMDASKRSEIVDVPLWCSHQGGVLPEYATALINMSPTSADVERSFSLTGVLDTKLGTSTRP